MTSPDLKSLRLNCKMTQSQAAKEVGISQNHYSNIEIGNRRPSVKVAIRLSGVLGFDWTDFFIKKD